MTIVMLVAWHVVKESLRERVLCSIAAVAGALVVGAALVAQVSAGQDVRVMTNLGLAVIELSGVVMAVFLGVQIVTREVERRLAVNVLVKPVHWWQFIVGKYMGLVVTITVNMAAVLLLFLVVRAAMPGDATLPAALAQAWLLLLCEWWLLAAVAVCVSTFASNGPTAVLLTLGIWIAGLLSADLRAFDGAAPWLTMFVRAGGMIVPAFVEFDAKTAAAGGRSLAWADVLLTIAYGWLYAAGLVTAAATVFSRRELVS